MGTGFAEHADTTAAKKSRVTLIRLSICGVLSVLAITVGHRPPSHQNQSGRRCPPCRPWRRTRGQLHRTGTEGVHHETKLLQQVGAGSSPSRAAAWQHHGSSWKRQSPMLRWSPSQLRSIRPALGRSFDLLDCCCMTPFPSRESSFKPAIRRSRGQEEAREG